MTYILSTTDGTLGLAHPCYRCGIQPEELPNFLTKVWRNMALVLKTTSVCFFLLCRTRYQWVQGIEVHPEVGIQDKCLVSVSGPVYLNLFAENL